MKGITQKSLFSIVRWGMSFIFLWAFLDKTFGLGFATLPENAWIRGGSPTTGYLVHATHGPLAGVFRALAGSSLVDGIFMLGLLGVGLGLLVPRTAKLASYAGISMLGLMYLSAFPPQNNLIIDEHVMYILILLLLTKQENI